MGNLASVCRALERCGASVRLVQDAISLSTVERLVLPGVGSFQEAMTNLTERRLVDPIRDAALDRKVPLMGICLGMQLLASYGKEGRDGGCRGLDLIPGEVIPLHPVAIEEKIPHVGWNEVHLSAPHLPLVRTLCDRMDFYFVHSYHFQTRDAQHIVGTTPYCGGFTSIVADRHVYGTQFHPEKSSKHGLRLIESFLGTGELCSRPG
jgi:glutamine amidotransferase